MEITQEMIDELAEKIFYQDTPWGSVLNRTWEEKTEHMLDICRGRSYKILNDVFSLKAFQDGVKNEM